MEAVIAGLVMSIASVNISIAHDFSPYPHGRTEKDGGFSGAKFRDEVLVPAVRDALRDHVKVVVNLDGVKALGSSFSEEAFGGLIRKRIAPSQDVMSVLEVTYTSPWLRPFAENIHTYMDEAARA